jgi:hypothetical protein
MPGALSRRCTRWIEKLFRTSKKVGKPSRRASRRVFPQLQCLEDRIAPSVDVFTNPQGGDWSVGSNWSLGAPPTSAQDATVTPGSSVVVTHSTGSDTVQTLTSDGSLTVTGGSLSVMDSVEKVVASGPLNKAGKRRREKSRSRLFYRAGPHDPIKLVGCQHSLGVQQSADGREMTRRNNFVTLVDRQHDRRVG